MNLKVMMNSILNLSSSISKRNGIELLKKGLIWALDKDYNSNEWNESVIWNLFIPHWIANPWSPSSFLASQICSITYEIKSIISFPGNQW